MNNFIFPISIGSLEFCIRSRAVCPFTSRRNQPISGPIFAVSARALVPSPPIALFSVWLVLTFSGMATLWIYSTTPGHQDYAPTRWPTFTTLQRASDRCTLVMFVHPKCPCSRASLDELAAILAHSGGHLRADVVFLSPTGEPASWVHTDLWETALRLPETSTISDPAGRQARLFHASVSGETLVYDSLGNLRFHGGITDGRGHAGDNPGCSAIQTYLNTGTAPTARTPVFGCPLFDDSTP